MTTTLKRKARKLQSLTGMSYQAAVHHIRDNKAFGYQGKIVTPEMLLTPPKPRLPLTHGRTETDG